LSTVKTILLQFDTDPHPSSFDRVVAVDAGVDEVFGYGAVTPENVTPLVHGGLFTRGPADLSHTAVFIGGSQADAGETLLAKVQSCFFGPIRMSVMLDSNGSNTTAAAAVLSARRHLPLAGTRAMVLAGTGPVGQRVAQLLVIEGAQVRLGSRRLESAARTAEAIRGFRPGADIEPVVTATAEELAAACHDRQLIISAGAAGIELLPAGLRDQLPELQVAIDLNAVPPVGIAGIDPLEKAVERQGTVCYGAIGVGGLKMKIHKACLKRLFTACDQVLETVAIYRIGAELV
jgi:hypothetical protein